MKTIHEHLKTAEGFADAALDAKEKLDANPNNTDYHADIIISEIFAEEELVEASILFLKFFF